MNFIIYFFFLNDKHIIIYGDVLRFFEKIVAYIQILFKNFIIN